MFTRLTLQAFSPYDILAANLFFTYQLGPHNFLISFVHILLQNKVAQLLFVQMFYVFMIFFSVSRTCVQNICLIRYPHVLEHLCHIPSGIWRIPKEIGTPASKSVTDTHTRVHM
jgi:hypothetical protein